jgi:DNA helicase-2/ATP-dependent DNA helicase PcrA
MTAVNLRPEQEDIVLGYTGGLVGIAAVPGSGKTFTLAHLAARLIYDQRLAPDQEVLVVTFTNSAVNSFQARIAHILRDQYGLVPFVGYRVRTLHGLAHDIVRERPALVGLADDFVILDEKLSLEIQHDIVVQRLPEWSERLSNYLDPEGNPQSARRAFEQDLPDLVIRFIKHAKDLRQGPDDLLALAHSSDFDLVRFATYVYDDYQRSLAYRGAVDFDDLVRLALEALERDPDYLWRLRKQWPFVLEDEAQDSSHLQEEMLRLLSDGKNWARVGDPNQAINTTFTTAAPEFLLNFLDSARVTEYPLSVSGRSTPSIIMLANELVRWTVEEHPVPELRDAFFYRLDARRGVTRGYIRPARPGDAQPSPDDAESLIVIHYRPDQKITPDKELESIVSDDDFSLLEWLSEIEEQPEEMRPTVAVLVPENSRGFKAAELLRRYGVRYEELLRSTTETRQTVALLQTLLEYLSDPGDLRRLKQLYWSVMSENRREQVQGDIDLRETISEVFKRWQNLESFLWPGVADSLGELQDSVGDYVWLLDDLRAFRQQVRRWLEAASLPIDQLVLTVAQDIFAEAVDIALAHKIAVLLHGVAGSHPDWRLPQFVEELRVISSNERRFIGFDDAEAGYEPKPGVVTVATMHAAKGLEWDRVYLLAVSNYGFPSALQSDPYIGEKWYVRGSVDFRVQHLNLEAELLAQLSALSNAAPYIEGDATLQARVDYAKERLRLFYVGITRARRELVVTWNMGRFWQRGREYENQPAMPLVMLGGYVEREF